jgi:hypothetical protein
VGKGVVRRLPVRRGNRDHFAKWCATRKAAVVQKTKAENAPATLRVSWTRLILAMLNSIVSRTNVLTRV